MNVVQILLVLVFAAIVLWFVSRQNTYQARAGMKLFMLGFTLVALIAIVFPDSSNVVAHWVGVSYGVNLLVYILALAFTFLVLHLYLKEKRDQERITKLARKIALLEASRQSKQKNH